MIFFKSPWYSFYKISVCGRLCYTQKLVTTVPSNILHLKNGFILLRMENPLFVPLTFLFSLGHLPIKNEKKARPQMRGFEPRSFFFRVTRPIDREHKPIFFPKIKIHRNGKSRINSHYEFIHFFLNDRFSFVCCKINGLEHQYKSPKGISKLTRVKFWKNTSLNVLVMVSVS